MAVNKILLLGNPQLYQESEPIIKEGIASLKSIIQDLHDTLSNFRKVHRVGELNIKLKDGQAFLLVQ